MEGRLSSLGECCRDLRGFEMRGYAIVSAPRPDAASVPDGAPWGETVTTGTVRGNPCLVYERRPSTVTQILDEARRWPDRAFIVQGSRVLTFREHERLVHTVAARLHAEGVRRGDRVAVFAANSPEWVSAFFAILLLGAVAVPCNGWWSAPEMAQACDMVDPILVCSDAGLEARSPRRIRQIPITDLVGGTASNSPPAEADYPCLTENDPAVILFTAGTTTFPKGATLSHRSLVANTQTLLTIARKLPHQISNDTPPSVTLVGLPLFHIGAIQLILVPLVTGGEVVFF
jgi:long-chain acyl-CoA synthetase